jgi:hypothetical protein
MRTIFITTYSVGCTVPFDVLLTFTGAARGRAMSHTFRLYLQEIEPSAEQIGPATKLVGRHGLWG